MEKCFDFGALLKNNEKKHKEKPPQFVSVASGIQIRLASSLRNTKSNRRTIFDRIRNISECDSPVPAPAPSEAQLKVEHRRQQLEKWKAEKNKKKNEERALKKKPFVAGIPRAPLKFVLPPPITKPSTSGRVTRSQTSKATLLQPTPNTVKRSTQSFAPENAPFRVPEFKSTIKLPILEQASQKNKKKAMTYTFEPLNPKPSTSKQTQLRTAAPNRKTVVESSNAQNKAQTEPKNVKSKINTKPGSVTHPKTTKTNNNVFQTQCSSSGSGIAQTKTKSNKIKTPSPNKALTEKRSLTPKVLHLESTTSEDKSSSDEKSVKQKSVRRTIEASSADKNLSSESTSSVEDFATVHKASRKSSLQKNTTIVSINSSDGLNSDVEFIFEKAAITPKKSLLSTPQSKKTPKSESSSEEKLRSPKSPIELALTSEQMEEAKKISPCVTMSRGNDNARKEMKWKIDEGLLDDDTCEGDSVEHFRFQLASEIERMTATCLVWDKILEQAADQMPEAVQELALSAVGLARLLMSQKLQQFASLVERCAKPDPSMALVTPSDLRGFWDMVFMQVEDVDMRFKSLEELRARNWIEEKPAEVKKRVVCKAGAKKTAKPAANSRLRDMIAAARKAKQNQESQQSPYKLAPPSEPQKTFEAGFFSIRSPIKSPLASAPATPRDKNNLLKAVLSSEAKKSASRRSASFAMLRASILSKHSEYEGIAPLQRTPQMTPINIYATPGRSILKSTNQTSTKKSCTKSIKLVLFNEPDLSFMSLMSDNLQSDQDKKTDVKSIDGMEPFSLDSPNSVMSQMNVKKSKLSRQNAIEGTPKNLATEDRSPIMTRQRRKSIQTPKAKTDIDVELENKAKSTKRSTRKKKSVIEEELKEFENVTLEETSTKEEDLQIKCIKTKTPRRRTKKANANDEITQETEVEENTQKISPRKTALQELEVNVLETATPKRSTRMRRSVKLT